MPGVLATLVIAASLSYSYLDRTLWFPDTRHYAVRTLEVLGTEHADAKTQAADFLAGRGVSQPIDVVDQPKANLFRPRILYPLLSAPFVAVGGLNGLLVVPLVSTLLCYLILWRLFRRRGSALAASLVVLALAGSRTFTAYMPSALTDGLAIALIMAIILTLPGEERAKGAPLAAFALSLAAGLARETGPYLLSLSLAIFLMSRRVFVEAQRSWQRVALAVCAGACLSIAWTAAVSRRSPIIQIELWSGREGLSALLELPRLLGEAGVGMAASLARDPSLMVILLVCLYRPRSRESADKLLTASMVLGALTILVLNPVHTKLRLQLPVVPFLAIMAVTSLTQAFSNSSGGRVLPAD